MELEIEIEMGLGAIALGRSQAGHKILTQLFFTKAKKIYSLLCTT